MVLKVPFSFEYQPIKNDIPFIDTGKNTLGPRKYPGRLVALSKCGSRARCPKIKPCLEGVVPRGGQELGAGRRGRLALQPPVLELQLPPEPQLLEGDQLRLLGQPVLPVLEQLLDAHLQPGFIFEQCAFTQVNKFGNPFSLSTSSINGC